MCATLARLGSTGSFFTGVALSSRPTGVGALFAALGVTVGPDHNTGQRGALSFFCAKILATVERERSCAQEADEFQIPFKCISYNAGLTYTSSCCFYFTARARAFIPEMFQYNASTQDDLCKSCTTFAFTITSAT